MVIQIKRITRQVAQCVTINSLVVASLVCNGLVASAQSIVHVRIRS